VMEAEGLPKYMFFCTVMDCEVFPFSLLPSTSICASSSWILQSPQLQCAGSGAGCAFQSEFESDWEGLFHWICRDINVALNVLFFDAGYSPIEAPETLPVSDIALPMVTSQSAWNSLDTATRPRWILFEYLIDIKWYKQIHIYHIYNYIYIYHIIHCIV
jgi:hypothetical protein